MIKLVIWDLDGTLVDSSASLAHCMNLVLEKNGFGTYDVETYKGFIGHGLKRLCKSALGVNYNPETFDGHYKDLLSNYSKYYDYKLYVYEGIHDCLDFLKESGCYLAVNTNKRQDAANIIVEKYFGKYHIEHVYGAADDRPKKPDPHSVIEIMKNHGVSRDEVLYIGDSDIDMMTGKNAAVHRIGVAWGFRTIDELKEHNPEHIVKKPVDLLKLLKEVVR